MVAGEVGEEHGLQHGRKDGDGCSHAHTPLPASNRKVFPPARTRVAAPARRGSGRGVPVPRNVTSTVITDVFHDRQWHRSRSIEGEFGKCHGDALAPSLLLNVNTEEAVERFRSAYQRCDADCDKRQKHLEVHRSNDTGQFGLFEQLGVAFQEGRVLERRYPRRCSQPGSVSFHIAAVALARLGRYGSAR
jgi:hypothetical protein